MGTHKQIKSTNEHTKHKPRLNTQKNTLGPSGLYELVLVAVHMENFRSSDVQLKCQGPLQLLSPPFLMTSTTKQMWPNGRGGRGVQKDPENRPWAGYNEAEVGFQKHYWSTYQMYQWL